MVNLYLPLLGLLGLVSALPNPSSTSTWKPTSTSTSTSASPTASSYSLNQVARFENSPDALPVVAASPVDIYLDIYWQGFSYVVTGGPATLVTGVQPNSPPNAIAFSTDNAVTIQQGTPSMTTVYDDSTVSSVDIFSFFFGCTVASESSEEGVPASCMLTVTGFNTQGVQVAQQTFSFVANGLLQQMQEATLVGFTGLQRATFAVNSAVDAVLVDTVTYTVHGTVPIPN